LPGTSCRSGPYVDGTPRQPCVCGIPTQGGSPGGRFPRVIGGAGVARLRPTARWLMGMPHAQHFAFFARRPQCSSPNPSGLRREMNSSVSIQAARQLRDAWGRDGYWQKTPAQCWRKIRSVAPLCPTCCAAFAAGHHGCALTCQAPIYQASSRPIVLNGIA